MSSPSILRLTGPLVISFWLRSAFAWVDTIFAAQLESLEGVAGLGDASIAAIGLALPFEFLTIACWVGSSNGLTTRLAAAMGAEEHQRVEQLKRAALRIVGALCGGFLLVALGIWLLAPAVLSDRLLAGQFQLYGTILVGGSALTSFWAILPDSVVKAHQDTRGTMWAGLLSGVTNLILNAVFVFVFEWGIAGIAASTVLGRLAGLSFALHRAAGHEGRRRAGGDPGGLGVFSRPVRAILVLAVPGAVTYLLMAVEAVAVFGVIAQLAPEDQAVPLLAAWAIFDRVVRFLVMPGIACSVALLPLVARFSGQGDLRAIRRELGVAERAGWLYSGAFVLPLVVLAGPWIARVLSDRADTQAFAAQGVLWAIPAVAVAIPFFLARSTFDGLQRPRPGLFASFIRAFLLYIPAMAGGFVAAQALEISPMHGICAGVVLGTAAASGLIRNWIGRHLREMAADGHSPDAARA